jgi:hypothetical protein
MIWQGPIGREVLMAYFMFRGWRRHRASDEGRKNNAQATLLVTFAAETGQGKGGRGREPAQGNNAEMNGKKKACSTEYVLSKALGRATKINNTHGQAG